MLHFNDIFYYDDDFQMTGDPDYLKERCHLDIVTADRAGDRPVILFFHGGGLKGGEKFFPGSLASNEEFVTVTVNYRLSAGRAHCPDYLRDAAAAAAWVFRHIREYGGNPEQVTVTGHSGGAYLAAMIGMAPGYLQACGQDCRRFLLIAPISGQMTTHFQIINERKGTDQELPDFPEIDEYSPMHWSARNLSPILLITGDPDLDWPARAEENLLLAAQLRRIEQHPDARCITITGFDHGGVLDPGLLLLCQKARQLLAASH